jgi:bifunctional non-homologous end joining protein LigD
VAGAKRLEDYRGKRDPSATPEPGVRDTTPASGAHRAGDTTPASGAHRARDATPASGAHRARDATRASEGRRFVIHEHSARRLHWDLRLERDGVLACWALPKGLPEEPGDNRFAAATEEHPLAYLDFHGEIPKGQYGAGTMTIWDSGTYECLKWEARKVEVALHGGRVDARYALFPIEQGQAPKDWMIHRMDPPADLARERMPEHVVPMLARAGELPGEEEGWAYEIKWDGVRAIAYSRPGELRLESRNLNDITNTYPELARVNRALSSHSAVLDGEIVAFDGEGRPSFAALQRRMHVASKTQAKRLTKDTPVTYMIFDLLWLDGHSLMGLSYAERRELLAALELDGESWQTPEHVVGEGAALLEASIAQRLEGVVAKRLDSIYQPGVRARGWVKVKGTGRQEFVVGGWLAGKGKRKGTVGALLLGVYDADGALRYVGRVGSGFSERELRLLSSLLGPLELEHSPFTAGERPPREAMFTEPQLVVEVKFAHWTEDGSLRAPVYEGLREDKDAAEVVREDVTVGYPAGRPATTTANAPRAQVDGRELKLSNLDKVLYPRAGTDKRAVIDYYSGIAPVLLGHLAGRPLTVVRWPDGVEAKSFFQKHAPAHRPSWVHTVTLAPGRTRKGTPPSGAHPEGHTPAGGAGGQAGKPIDYILAEDLPTLVWLANLAAIELHVPLSRAQDMERPTAVVFDLDPGQPAGVVECCRVATLLRDVFAGVGLESFAKTSGSKGLQVYIPLNHDGVSYEQTKPFAKTVAELLEQAEPELVISRMTRARRTGKVLIDWSQNDARKTTVCAYSLRAGERPTVSTPLDWEEVEAARDSGDGASLAFEAAAVLARVADRGDLFASVLSLVQELPA